MIALLMIFGLALIDWRLNKIKNVLEDILRKGKS